MDSKRLMIMMLASLAILLGWQYFIMEQAKRNNWDMGQRPPEVTTTEQTPAAPEPFMPEAAAPAPGATPGAPAPAPAIAAPAPGAPTSPDATATQTQQLRILSRPESTLPVHLGSSDFKDNVWSMGVDLTSRGAAISQVTLTEFPRNEEFRRDPYIFQRAEDSPLASMATAYAVVNGQRFNLAAADWVMSDSSRNSVEYLIEIGTDAPALRIRKRFTTEPKVDAQTQRLSLQQGYEILVRHRVENLSDQPMQVELGLGGPTLPPRELDRGPDRHVVAGYNKNFQYPQASLIEAQAWPIESLTGEQARLNITRGEKDRPLIWAGLSSTYFNAFVLPVSSEPHRTAEFIHAVHVRAATNSNNEVTGAEVLFQTRQLSIPAGSATELDLVAFMGPKARATVKNAYYGTFPREYDVSLTITGSCALCTIQWLVDLMVWLLRVFHAVLFDWGLAIVALVVLVRALMHPLTRKSTISMHRMSKLAPEIERIKKKYADNPEEQQRAMMAFYKEHGAGQILGCLPMFVQMPIWIALWSALHSTFELRLAPFLWGFTWIDDLAKPDRFITFTPINLGLFHLDSINLLPLGMALVFYLQQRFMPKPATMTPEQAQQQKMMQWMMVLLFPLMLYNGPSGLNLYIFTSTAVGMMESKWIRDHLKRREAEEAAAGPKFIDVPASKARNKGEPEQPTKPAKPPEPKGRFGQFIERMRKLAADAQRQAQQQQQQRQKKDKK